MQSCNLNKNALIRDWYARFELDSSRVEKIEPRDANKWNEQGFAIAWTVNDFGHERRLKTNLKNILSVFVDMDADPKDRQREIIKQGPIPSAIIESKNGYHVYYDVKNFPCDPDFYREFLIDRTLDRFNADQNCMTATAMLRVPNLYHLKDPKNKFMVNWVGGENIVYDFEHLCELLPVNKNRKRIRDEAKHMASEYPEIKNAGGDAYNIYTMNQLDALKKISGHACIGGDTISFKPESGIRYRIFINGERKNKWIDAQGKIGSTSGHGPTVFQFIRAYGNTTEKTISAMKEIFKEKFE